MLACLKVGAIYVNVDYANPQERLMKIFEVCQPKIIIYNSQFSSNNIYGIEYDATCVDLASKEFGEEVEAADSGNLMETQNVHGNMVAYIMFTSGSTGSPKGAAMTHENVIHFINWSVARFEISPNDVLTNVNPIYFDNSVFDFYTALFSGASFVPISHANLRTPKELLNIINKMECTIWFSVPSLLIYLLNLKILTPTEFKGIRKIIFGGEGFPKPKLKELYDLLGQRVSFTNVYGPTECTCICSSYDMGAGDLDDESGILPLGSINQNYDYLILDDRGKRVSDGATGELCLLGPCVGRGYYGKPELTAKAFVANPHSTHLQEIMYCTGDLVFQDVKTGKLHFVARKDNQIKHQGYRIELDEIEAVLYRLNYIHEAAVIYSRNNDSTGRIKAIIVVVGDKNESDVICDMRRFLPEYMLPRKIYFREELPKNQNGKIDRVLLTREYHNI
jgi:D-alanine--poly(phosphoribitol) ligase subunit 1